MLEPNPANATGLDPERIFSGVCDCRRIGLAVSGGTDSLALMWLAKLWRERRGESGPQLFIYSVDHGLRKEAGQEVADVVTLGRQLGFEARGLQWDGAKPQTGVQAAARKARYRLMGEAMLADGVECLLTAHHRDDQAETILMRLARGSGLAGLSGMRDWSEVEGVRIHRPLLGVARAQLETLVKAAGLPPVEDPSNVDSKYERVRWRQLMPELSVMGLDGANLGRFSERMARADQALASQAENTRDRYVEIDAFGCCALPHHRFAALDEEIALRVLDNLIACAGAAHARLEQLEDILPQVRCDTFAGASLGGALLQIRSAQLIVMREAARISPNPQFLPDGGEAVFDYRFVIGNKSPQTLEVRPAFEVSREAAETFVGGPILAPMAAVRAAPLVVDRSGRWIALGEVCPDGEVSISPIHPPKVNKA